jgi:small GTP-binding protein
MDRSVVFIGKESVGKSQLVNSLACKGVVSEKVKGTTIAIQSCEANDFRYIDTPGILFKSDSVTTKLAIEEIPNKDCVVLVISATEIDQDLSDLLSLVKGKPGVIVITHWDRMKVLIDQKRIQKLEKEVGIPLIKVDARNISEDEKDHMLDMFSRPEVFKKTQVKTKIGVTLEPKKGVFDIPVIGKLLSLVLLFLPTWIAVQFAIFLADSLYQPLFDALDPLLQGINDLPTPLDHLLAENYGIVAMLPFLILYALPTVLLFALILSLYKTSGLIDRITVSIHQLVIPFGLTGRDVVRVMMGFGCNVPAVISTRTCSARTRGNCVSAICFGSACSYQLPATLAVFAAADMAYLVIPYLAILLVSTLIYLWIVNFRQRKLSDHELKLPHKDFLQLPKLRSWVSETTSQVRTFITVAFPIFLMICLVAGLLDWLGIFDFLSTGLEPVMSVFNLPGEASTSVILGSVRKDGIAIGLLNPDWDGLKVPLDTGAQVLTVVYLAGVLLPCIVTIYTVAKEMNLKFALKLVPKQITVAIIVSLLIAWIGYLIY